MSMWQRFNEKAQLSIYLAQEHAKRLGCTAIDADLIFLGCADVADPGITGLLTIVTPSVSDLKAAAEAQAATKANPGSPDDMTLTRGGKRVTDEAHAASMEMGDSFVGPEHLLIGVARQSTSFFASVLARRKISGHELIRWIRYLREKEAEVVDSEPSTGLSSQLAKMQPLDALAVMTIREIKLIVSLAESNRLQELLNRMDEVHAIIPTRSGADPIAETFADAVHLASERREPLAAAHVLAAMYRRVGSLVNLVAPSFYASPAEMMERLVPKAR